MSWTAIVHAHSRRSYDGLGAPAELAEEAVRLGAHVLAITDHDTWTGSIEAADHARARRLPLLVVPGSEVATDEGDVLALFVEEDRALVETLTSNDQVAELADEFAVFQGETKNALTAVVSVVAVIGVLLLFINLVLIIK